MSRRAAWIAASPLLAIGAATLVTCRGVVAESRTDVDAQTDAEGEPDLRGAEPETSSGPDAGAPDTAPDEDAPSCDWWRDASDECSRCGGQQCCSEWTACRSSKDHDCYEFAWCASPGTVTCISDAGVHAPCDGGCDGSGDLKCCEETHPVGAAQYHAYFACLKLQCHCY